MHRARVTGSSRLYTSLLVTVSEKSLRIRQELLLAPLAAEVIDMAFLLVMVFSRGWIDLHATDRIDGIFIRGQVGHGSELPTSVKVRRGPAIDAGRSFRGSRCSDERKLNCDKNEDGTAYAVPSRLKKL